MKFSITGNEMTFYPETVKADWVSRARQHQEFDRFAQGEWLRTSEGEIGGNFRGCFFGCMTQSSNGAIEFAAKEMQLPEWILYLAEWIFENLPSEDAKKFPLQFSEVMPAGISEKEIRGVWHATTIKRLDVQLGLTDSKEEDVISAIKEVRELHIKSTPARSAAWSAAESAARSAAESAAESAAWSVAWSAAWSVARSAAWSAAWSAARSAAATIERDNLLSVLQQAEVS